MCLGKSQKSYFFWWPGHQEGGGGKRLRKKNFFEALKKSQRNVATKLEGGGALKKIYFCGLPKSEQKACICHKSKAVYFKPYVRQSVNISF